MKIKSSFFVFCVICVFLFSTCDLLNGDEKNENNNNNENGTPSGGVAPLLQTQWSQGAPYNNMLREMDIGNIDNLTVNICGIVARAQIMRYHKHPARGIGQSEPWTTDCGVNLSPVNFEIDFDWGNMLYDYTSSANEQQRNAVAVLYHAISIGRVNNLSSLTSHFGYDRSIRRLERLYYDDVAWESIIREQLDAGLPVYYWGTGNGSHAFILDGYDNTGRFHVNWGWGGSHNGWFSLKALNPRENDFNNNQHMIINFKPDVGGAPAGYEMAILSLTANKVSVRQNELLVIHEEMRNISNFESFPGGQIGAALVDNSGNIVEIIGSRNSSTLGAGLRYGSPRVINCIVPVTVEPGQYSLRIVTRTEGGDWKIVTLSAVGNGILNFTNLTVYPCESITPTGGYGQTLLVFTTEKNYIAHGDTTHFTVSLEMRNMTSETFSGGQYAVALLDDKGNLVSILGTGNSGTLGAGLRHGTPRVINCTVPNTVPPGQYRLRILVRPASGEWRIATLSMPDIPNSFEFMVQ
jgi:hypothetical protein